MNEHLLRETDTNALYRNKDFRCAQQSGSGNNIFGIHSDFSSLKIRILKILERQVLEDFFRSVNQAVPILEVTHDKRCQV